MTASGRNWFEAYTLLLIGGWAAVSWLGGVEGETIAAIFTTIGKNLWFIGLIIGSVISLLGIMLGTYTGMLIEQAGLYLLAGLFGWVGFAFLGFATHVDALHLAFVTPLMILVAIVAISRTRQIKNDLPRMRTQMILRLQRPTMETS